MPTVLKKNGTVAPFDKVKIQLAAAKAFEAVQVEPEKALLLGAEIANQVEQSLQHRMEVSYNDIHDRVELALMDANKQAAKAYIIYRQTRKNAREGRDQLLDKMVSISKQVSRDNANIRNGPSSKMYEMASAVNTYFVTTQLLPKDVLESFKNGEIHPHDLNYYQLTYNCLNYDLKKLLQNGFRMPHGFIRPPKSIMAASALTAVSLQSVQNDQYGGVGIDRVDEALAPWAEKATTREVEQAMEALIFNLNSLHSRAGNQIPFSSLSLGVGIDEGSRKVCKAILDMYDKGLGKGELAMFPNLIFKIKEGINWNPDDPNHDLLKRALEVSSRRMNPTYLFLDATFNEPYGLEAMAMGCRTRVVANRHGGSQTAGRGNIAFTSINLPRIAIRVTKDITSMADFWSELDRVMGLCERQLLHRYDLIKKLYVKDVPFVFGEGIYMGSENLKSEDHIEPALKNGTLTIGFVGLAEALKQLTGHTHAESPEAQQLGLMIVKRMRKFCDEASERNDLNFSLIATPAETLAGKFLNADRQVFGVIPGVTDKEYYTNSFHVPVTNLADIVQKIEVEAPYHELCNGGHISYIELGSPPHPNAEGLYTILSYMKMYNMGYVGFNYPIDFCDTCGYSGIIGTECPRCGGSESVRRIRRVTGYFSSMPNIGDPKKAEILDRVSHANRRE